MTRFQRVNLWIGLASLALVACMALGQTQARLGADAAAGSAYATR